MAQNRGAGRGKIPSAAEYGSVGLQFAAGLVAFSLAGAWLDRRLGSSPWLLLIGVALGFGLSSAWIYRQLVIRPREREQEDEGRS